MVQLLEKSIWLVINNWWSVVSHSGITACELILLQGREKMYANGHLKNTVRCFFEKIQDPCFPLKQQKKLLTEKTAISTLQVFDFLGVYWLVFQIKAVLLQDKNVRLHSCCFSTSSLLTPSSVDARLLSSSDSSEASLLLLASCSDTSSWRSSTWSCSCCERPRATSTSCHASANWAT